MLDLTVLKPAGESARHRYFRYSPKCISIDNPLKPLQTLSTDGLTEKLNENTGFNWKTVNGVYVSTCRFDDAFEARKYLALTYCPKYRGEFEKSPPPPRAVLKNSYGEEEFQRVWPAYGRKGGGWEIALVKGELKGVPRSSHKYWHNCGSKWWMDGVQADFVYALARSLSDVISSADLAIEGEAFKASDDGGMVFSWWSWGKKVAVSAGFRPNRDGVEEIKLWGRLWKDDENVRRIGHDHNKLVSIRSKPLKCIVAELGNNQGCSAEIKAKLESLLKNLGDEASNQWNTPSFQLPKRT